MNHGHWATRPAVAGLALAMACTFAPLERVAAEEVTALPDGRWRSFQTGMVRADRIQHGSLAFTLALGAGVMTRPAGGFAFAVGLGVAKELIDMRGPGFDGLDLCADIAGAALAWPLARSIAR